MSHLTPYAQQILASAASVGMPQPESTTVSEADMIVQLQRENARLQTETDGAKGRAAHRHQEMMHANRRAERAENAFDKQTEEWKAHDAKNHRLWCGYTQTIEGLEAQIENQKTQSQKEAREDQVKIVAETEERLRKQFQNEIGAMKLQFKASLQAMHNQIQELKKQLQQATQREVTQTSQIATGTHAGDPLQHQQSSDESVTAGDTKRKRQDSTGDAGSALPEPKRSRPDPTASAPTASWAPSTAPKAKTPAATRAPRRPNKSSQPSRTLNQQMITPQYRQHSIQGVPSQVIQQSQQQAAPPRPSSSSDPVSFQQAFQMLNNQRLAQGKPTLNQKQAREILSDMIQRKNQQSARSASDRGGVTPTIQQESSHMLLSQGGAQPTMQKSSSIDLSLSNVHMHAGVQPSSLNGSKLKPFGQTLGARQGVQFGGFQPQSPQKAHQPPANTQANVMGNVQFGTIPELGPSMLSFSGPSAFPSLGNQDFNSLDQSSYNNDGGLYMPTLDDFNGLDYNFDDPILRQTIGNNKPSGLAAQTGVSAQSVNVFDPAGSTFPQKWLNKDSDSNIPIDPALLPSAAQDAPINAPVVASVPPALPVTTFPQMSHQAPAVSVSQVQPTHAPVHSTPAATPAPTVRNPQPVINDLRKPCLHCYEHWWNSTCDEGEPCFNCHAAGVPCERPLCHNDATGCANDRCTRVHTSDSSGYENVLARPKTLKRKGAMYARSWSPKEAQDGEKNEW